MKTRTRKVLLQEEAPEFRQSIEQMADDSRIFVDKSVEIAYYIHYVMEQQGMKQKELAERMGKTEAEVSKWLGGLHNYTLRSLAKLESALGTKVIYVQKPQYAISYHKPAASNIDTIRTVTQAPPRQMQYRKATEFIRAGELLKKWIADRQATQQQQEKPTAYSEAA